LTDRLKGRKRLVLEILGLSIGALFFGVLGYKVAEQALQSVVIHERLYAAIIMPVYPIKVILALSVLLLALILIIECFIFIFKLVSHQSALDSMDN
jgi:hypothetical protein